jgi:hypothetical protein
MEQGQGQEQELEAVVVMFVEAVLNSTFLEEGVANMVLSPL